MRENMVNRPAAIVSPSRRIKILPISLFTEKGSKGIDCGLIEGPEYVGLRKVICTSADIFFVITLYNGMNLRQLVGSTTSYLGLLRSIAPDALSSVEINFDILAGTSLEWWYNTTWEGNKTPT